MIEITASDVIKATGGRLIQGSETKLIKGISIDSRTLKKGDLFIALPGENFKGEDFIAEALSKGACGYISQIPETRYQGPEGGVGRALRARLIIQVSDTLKAFQGISNLVLRKVKPKVIAITGSNGKTSTKDMLRAILTTKYKVVASEGNYNNEIGLPLTLLKLQSGTEIVILEMGMRAIGQIKELCEIAQPDIAIITNIGYSHIGKLGSIENIITAKAEIAKCLVDDGVLFLNADDQTMDKLSAISFQQPAKKIIYFGSRGKAEVRFSEISYDELARPSFELAVSNQPSAVRVNLSISGKHQVYNACGAAAVALHLGLSLKEISKALAEVKLSAGRMKVSQSDGWLIIDDSYNASPASMKSAIDSFEKIIAAHKIAVLGDMLELGEYAVEQHIKIGKLVASGSISKLFTVGRLAEEIAKGAIAAGMAKDDIKIFSDSLSLRKEIISLLKPNDAILIKASRAIKLDIVANYLQNKR